MPVLLLEMLTRRTALLITHKQNARKAAAEKRAKAKAKLESAKSIIDEQVAAKKEREADMLDAVLTEARGVIKQRDEAETRAFEDKMREQLGLASAALTLEDKVDILREELGLKEGQSVEEMVDEAVEIIGLAGEMSGMTLIDAVDCSLSHLGRTGNEARKERLTAAF